MAEISIPSVSSFLAHAVRTDYTSQDSGQVFDRLLTNHVKGTPECGPGYKQRGITLCYGHNEGFPAIHRAFQSLKESIDPEEFGIKIARALNIAIAPFPTGEHNLVYAHFLLHGLAQDTVDLVVEKIIDNARILHETDKARDTIKAQFGEARDVLENRYYLKLENGDTDDFHGHSLRLFQHHASDKWYNDRVFSKAGFFIDTTNSTACIVNLQGRMRSRDKLAPAALKMEKEAGRDYARITHLTGLEPRAYVLTQLFNFLESIGIKEVLAIRSAEHVMSIGKHRGFFGNYDHVFAQAGMRELNPLYYTKTLSEKFPAPGAPHLAELT